MNSVDSAQHWTQGGDAITNFSLADLPIYQRAIHEHGDSRLYIGAPTPRGFSCDKALRVRGLNGSAPDLSEFWTVFKRVRAENQESARAAIAKATGNAK